MELLKIYYNSSSPNFQLHLYKDLIGRKIYYSVLGSNSNKFIRKIPKVDAEIQIEIGNVVERHELDERNLKFLEFLENNNKTIKDKTIELANIWFKKWEKSPKPEQLANHIISLAIETPSLTKYWKDIFINEQEIFQKLN